MGVRCVYSRAKRKDRSRRRIANPNQWSSLWCATETVYALLLVDPSQPLYDVEADADALSCSTIVVAEVGLNLVP